ncbi:hypothetical protein [Phaeospirillum tilakii]|uniref:Lipoprotein n=1 Tax=Phaeospirillum tilakii TaxID=741673 RepID=A0ABW5CFU8_9PROT
MRWQRVGAMVALGLLAGCGSQLPPPESVAFTSPVAGRTPPLPARVMVYAGQDDLARPLKIQVTSLHSEENPEVKDGLALARAATTVLGRAFARVALDDAALRPQIVVRPYGKALWFKLDGQLRIGCGLDAYTADGFPLGNFAGRFSVSTGNYQDDLLPAYAQCLKRPVESLLASPALARLAAAGFADPPAGPVEAWMRTLGPIPTPP